MGKPERDLIILGCIGAVAVFIFVWCFRTAQDESHAKSMYCRNHGGTFLAREDKCIEVKEIEMP